MKNYNIGDLVELNKGCICEYLGGGFPVGLSEAHLYRPISDNHPYSTVNRGFVINGAYIRKCIPFSEKMNVRKVYHRAHNEEDDLTTYYEAGELILDKIMKTVTIYKFTEE